MGEGCCELIWCGEMSEAQQQQGGKKRKKQRELPPIEPVAVPFVDSHCHLTYGTLAKEPEAVVARARNVGVGGMLTISTKLETFPEVLALAERFEDVWASVGTHPHHAEAEKDTVNTEKLVELAAHEKVIGIGEAGLDYFYDRSPREVQRQVFRQHIAATQQTGLPLIIHTREAEEDTARMLEEETAKGAFAFVMHCFSSAPWLAEKALELGGYVSFSGILTFRKSEEVRKAAERVPLERLLVETDAPFLAPEPYRGRICEPMHTAVTLRYLADLKGVSAEELARITSANFFRLFSKAKPPATFRLAA